jgi:hypothetical protein
MLHCDGSNGDTTFTDSSVSPKSVTARGTAQVSTAQSVFGGASCLLDGNSDYLELAESDDWDFGAGDFTIDLRVRYVGESGVMPIFTQWNGAGSYSSYFVINHPSTVWFYWSTNGTNVVGPVSWTWNPSTDTWYHIALVKHSTNKLAFFVDGTRIGSDGTMSDTIYNSSGILTIGKTGSVTNQWHNGYFDEYRVSKGIARWTSDFTPPTEAYSADVTSGFMTMNAGFWGA